MVLPLGGRQGQKMTIVSHTAHGDFIFVPMQKGTEE
jgi:hypothetical protein